MGADHDPSIQAKMLTGHFYIECIRGGHNFGVLPEAEDLVAQGKLTRRDISTEQSTKYEYTPKGETP